MPVPGTVLLGAGRVDLGADLDRLLGLFLSWLPRCMGDREKSNGLCTTDRYYTIQYRHMVKCNFPSTLNFILHRNIVLCIIKTFDLLKWYGVPMPESRQAGK